MPLSSRTLVGWKINLVSFGISLDRLKEFIPYCFALYLAQGFVRSRLFPCRGLLFLRQVIPPALCPVPGLDITHTNQQTVICFNERDFISRSQTVFLCDLQRDNNLPFGINNQSFHCSLISIISNYRYNN